MPFPSPKAFVLSPAASSPAPPSLAHLGWWPQPSSVTSTPVSTSPTQGAAAFLSSPDSRVSGESVGRIQAWSPLTTVWPWTSCGLLESGCPAAPRAFLGEVVAVDPGRWRGGSGFVLSKAGLESLTRISGVQLPACITRPLWAMTGNA